MRTYFYISHFQRDAENAGPPAVEYTIQQAVDSTVVVPPHASRRPTSYRADPGSTIIYAPPSYDSIAAAGAISPPPDYQAIGVWPPSASAATAATMAPASTASLGRASVASAPRPPRALSASAMPESTEV